MLAYFGYPKAHEDDAERAICLRQSVLLAERAWGSTQSTTIPPLAGLKSKNLVEFLPGLYETR